VSVVDFGDGTIVTSLPAAVGDAVVAAEPLRHAQSNAAIGGIWRVKGSAGSAVLKLATPPAPETADAARVTVRRALEQLRERGKVVTVHGRGNYVALEP